MRILFDASFQEAFHSLDCLDLLLDFGLTNQFEKDSHKKHFLPRVPIINYNVLIVGRDFYDQFIGNQISKYDKIRKIATGQGDDYKTRYLLNYQ